MALRRVISGGQIGADIAGLRAAKEVCLETGGWMPRDFKARDGNHPEYARLYGMKQHKSPLYPPRTKQNVLDSDATVRFAYNFSSRGEICTMNAICSAGKPWFDVDLTRPRRSFPNELGEWLDETQVEVLNVAGNADPQIEDWVREFLIYTFALIPLDTG